MNSYFSHLNYPHSVCGTVRLLHISSMAKQQSCALSVRTNLISSLLPLFMSISLIRVKTFARFYVNPDRHCGVSSAPI